MRERILDAAYTCFVEQGYHATTTHDVLAAAQVTGGALHHHFPTKKKLGLDVINERVARTVQDNWITPVQNAERAVKGALAVIGRIGKELKSNGKVRGCPLNNLAMELSYADADFRVATQEIFSRWTHAIATRIRADQKAGWRPDLDASACACLLVATYSGAMAMAKAEQSERPLMVARKMLEVQLG
jgi:TetR/AcrR family transcriptional repressor of nem operon